MTTGEGVQMHKPLTLEMRKKSRRIAELDRRKDVGSRNESCSKEAGAKGVRTT